MKTTTSCSQNLRLTGGTSNLALARHRLARNSGRQGIAAAAAAAAAAVCNEKTDCDERRTKTTFWSTDSNSNQSMGVLENEKPLSTP